MVEVETDYNQSLCRNFKIPLDFVTKCYVAVRDIRMRSALEKNGLILAGRFSCLLFQTYFFVRPFDFSAAAVGCLPEALMPDSICAIAF